MQRNLIVKLCEAILGAGLLGVAALVESWLS